MTDNLKVLKKEKTLNKYINKLPDDVNFLIQKYLHNPQPQNLLDSIHKYPNKPSIIKAINMFVNFHYLVNVKFRENHILDKDPNVKKTVLENSFETSLQWLALDLLQNLNMYEKHHELSRSFFNTLKTKKLIGINGTTIDMFFYYMKRHGSYKSKIIAFWAFMTKQEIKMYVNMIKKKLNNARKKINNN